MSKARFQTPASFRDELLRQSLLGEAFDAKRYYQDGFYKPETQEMQLAKAQTQFYNRIDQIGYRISSELYRANTTEGKLYRDTTKRDTQKIADDIEQSLRQGLMTPQTYDDLVGYLSEVIRSAQTGEFSRRRSRNVVSEMEGPTDLIQRLVSLNLTGMTNQQIAKILRDLGATQADVRRILELMQERLRQQAPPPAVHGNPGGGPDGPGDDENDDDLGPNQQNQNANIAHGNVQTRFGGEPDFTQQFYKQLDKPEEREKVLASGASATQAGRNRTAFEINRRVMEAEDGMTDRYGLSQNVYNALEKKVNTNMHEFLEEPPLTPNQFENWIWTEATNVKKEHPQFEENRWFNLYRAKYEAQYSQAVNEDAEQKNMAAGGGAVAMNQYANLMREDADDESRRNQYGVLDKNPTQAQISEAEDQLPNSDQIVQIINTQSSKDVAQILTNAKEGQLPLIKDNSAEIYTNEVNKQLQVLEGVQKQLQDMKQTGTANPFPLQVLLTLRSIVTPEMATMLAKRVEKSDVEKYPEFLKLTKKLDPNKAEDLMQLSIIKEEMTISDQEAIKMLTTTGAKTAEVARANPLAWDLKEKLNGSSADPETIASKFYMEEIGGRTTARAMNIIERLWKAVFETKTLQPVSALKQIDNIQDDIRNDPSRYGLKTRDQIRKVMQQLSDKRRTLSEKAVKLNLMKKEDKPVVTKGRPPKPKGKLDMDGGTRFDTKEYYQVGAPAQSAQHKDPPMRFTVGQGRRQNSKNAHDITIS
jgi:hypothetical protein